jgi:hypothetical protein
VEGTPHFNGENRTNGAEHGPAYFFEIERVHGTGLFAPHGEAVPVEHGNELDGLVVSVKEINYDEVMSKTSCGGENIPHSVQLQVTSNLKMSS